MQRRWMGWALAAAGTLLAASNAGAQDVQTMAKQEKGKVTLGQMVSATAKVEAIDLKTREVKLKFSSGEERTITVGEEARNLPQVEVGDNVEIQYYESITVELKKVDKTAASVSEKASEIRAEQGEKPGGVRVHEFTVVAEVVKVDEAAGTVTVRGPRGREVVLKPRAETLKLVKVGDFVEGVYTEALAISVSKVVVK
jgi:hypothetical protein